VALRSAGLEVLELDARIYVLAAGFKGY
jgi:hypothetical protein